MESKGFISRLFDLSFTEFITTKIIKVLFILGIIGAGIGALFILGAGFASRSFGGIVLSLILTPVAFLLYVILARVWMETLIVLFRIAENTAKIANGNPTTPQA
ncbi:MAG: DUF4282 domain-containing protein [Kiritimatiellia bacterium]|nr:DUF4282 domain-containing protein [Kiritimatiellia bacterium]